MKEFTNPYEIEIKRLQRKIRKKDIKIAAMVKYIRQLERENAKQPIDFPKMIEKTVTLALANVRLVPVLGLGTDKIVQINAEKVNK